MRTQNNTAKLNKTSNLVFSVLENSTANPQLVDSIPQGFPQERTSLKGCSEFCGLAQKTNPHDGEKSKRSGSRR
jgi:hypothetical protein